MINNLIIFTSTYPYGCGEEFLEEEIKIAENIFDRISIVTLAKEVTQDSKYIPSNAKITTIRANSNWLRRLLVLFGKIVSIRAIREICIGISERGVLKTGSIIKKVISTEVIIYYLHKTRNNWDFKFTNEFTIYYSYWLDACASYLAFDKDKNSRYVRISRTHGVDCFYDRSFHPYRMKQLENLDFIFPVSKGGKNDILAHYSKRIQNFEQKIIVKYLGINIPTLGKSARMELQSIPYKTIVSCSSIIGLKRLDILIDALALIQTNYIEWIHFGDGVLSAEIQKLASDKLSSKTNITFKFMGHQSRDIIFDFYNYYHVDLFINCSDTEGIPVSIMEANSYGIPAIARNVGGISELVNLDTGYLLPESASASDFAIVIEDFFCLDEEQVKKKRIQSRAFVEENFSSKKNYISFFEELKYLNEDKD